MPQHNPNKTRQDIKIKQESSPAFLTLSLHESGLLCAKEPHETRKRERERTQNEGKEGDWEEKKIEKKERKK